MMRLLLLTLTLLQAANADICSPVDKATTPAELVRYLEEQTAVGVPISPDCIKTAMRKVSHQLRLQTQALPASEVVPTLIRYLDFQIPPTEGVFVRAGIIREYPVIEPLFIVGLPAVPYLVGAIACEQSSVTSRAVALHALMAIYRADETETVRVLRRAALAHEGSQRQRLQHAIKDAVKRCIPENRASCEDAAKGVH